MATSPKGPRPELRVARQTTTSRSRPRRLRKGASVVQATLDTSPAGWYPPGSMITPLGPDRLAVVKPDILDSSTWMCDHGVPFPCLHRQRELLRRHGGDLPGLRRLMRYYRDRYLRDHPDADRFETIARFLAWIPKDPL